jgi:hypothetical protein
VMVAVIASGRTTVALPAMSRFIWPAARCVISTSLRCLAGDKLSASSIRLPAG